MRRRRRSSGTNWQRDPPAKAAPTRSPRCSGSAASRRTRDVSEALARWITPAAESRRYDTRFYILPLPDQQQGSHDRHETTDSFWATPAEVLGRWEAGEFFLAPPTTRTLQILSPAADIASAMAIARAQSLAPVCPFFAMDGGQAVLALPGDPLHPEPGEGSADLSAPTRFVLVDGRFVGRRAV